MNFIAFKNAVATRFEQLTKGPMFRVDLEKDELYQVYLDAFPEGSNPHYRERTEHDCSCCKSFIRAVGNVVGVVNDNLVSIWDIKLKDEPEYQVVADALKALVLSKPIADQFLHFEGHAGADKTFEEVMGKSKTWNHFFVNIPRNFVSVRTDIPSQLATPRETAQVFKRSLTEIDPEALTTVLELIAQNSIYRGEEHKWALVEFQKLQRAYRKIKGAQDREIFTWTKSIGLSQAVSRIRNTVIGTLLVDLSDGVDLERAVKSFEDKVAPTNYKRPTALVTKAMIQKAKEKIEQLGLTSALERRYAVLSDVSVNNVLFADRSAKSKMNGDVFDDLVASTSSRVDQKSLKDVTEISIEKFIKDVLPHAHSIEALFENRHVPNLVSLIAPADPTAGKLFKWDNRFSWSYNGELADSIKERVKKAGGSVEGDLCCRLAWFNHDDLDFHMIEPDGYEIMFSNRSQTSPSGGRLDVDMNAGYGQTREPVENIFYQTNSRMKEGLYKLVVHNFCAREKTNVGFEVEIDYQGEVRTFSYPKAVKDRESIVVAKMRYSKAHGLEFIEALNGTQSSKTVWGLPTQTFHRVNVMMYSPNHWDGQGVGNKHYLFMLDQCQNEDSARGFFNEFLNEEMTPHRKVLEMVGSKLKIEPAESQLSGLGFSSTQKNYLVVRVKGSFTRLLKVVF